MHQTFCPFPERKAVIINSFNDLVTNHIFDDDVIEPFGHFVFQIIFQLGIKNEPLDSSSLFQARLFGSFLCKEFSLMEKLDPGIGRP